MSAAHRRPQLRDALCMSLDRLGEQPRLPTPGYFVVMVDLGRRGREAIVDPEMTRREVAARIRTKDTWPIAFIHWCHDGACEDVTNDLLKEAGFYDQPIAPLSPSDHLAERFDHDRKLRVEAL